MNPVNEMVQNGILEMRFRENNGKSKTSTENVTKNDPKMSRGQPDFYLNEKPPNAK